VKGLSLSKTRLDTILLYLRTKAIVVMSNFLHRPFADPQHVRNLVDRDPAHMNWNAVVERVRTHPMEVTREALYGIAFIHRILQLNPSVEAVTVVVRVHPYALT